MLRAITGFCLAGLVMVAESWLNQAANNTNRGGVLATYMVVSLGAMAIGQFLLNLARPAVPICSFWFQYWAPFSWYDRSLA